MTRPKKVIPEEYIPDVGSHVETIDGQRYLIANDAMYTFYQRTKGEFSSFFLALRDEKRLLGCKCTECGLVRVPPFLTHCPD
ncbi:MAG: zinc ribbon domain-containing protein, partial [Desulfomonilaceae bacterium]|nr:zinc ribbon domain-containing protein [Desulfomonilaceae bacterium]